MTASAATKEKFNTYLIAEGHSIHGSGNVIEMYYLNNMAVESTLVAASLYEEDNLLSRIAEQEKAIEAQIVEFF